MHQSSVELRDVAGVGRALRLDQGVHAHGGADRSASAAGAVALCGDRRCRQRPRDRALRDLVYRWLCGGVGVNDHALSDFRSDHEAVLDRLLTDSVTALVDDGLISLERLAQDGVKAAAGAASFRRQSRLTAIREQMAERIERLKSDLEGDAAASQRRKQAARLRAATEREERCRKALVRLRELEIEREVRKPKGGAKDRKAVRASTTDA